MYEVSYVLDGTKILSQTYSHAVTKETYTVKFFYDANDAPIAMEYDGNYYYYRTNIQGDIEGIYNANGTLVVSYSYDTWGNILSATGTLASTVGEINPFRYRGYYYDTETGWYYLQSRYYDPEIGRFINGDIPDILVVAFMMKGLINTNLFAYCENDVVNNTDYFGYWKVPSFLLSMALDGIILCAAGTFNATWLGMMAPLKSLSKKAALKLFSNTIVPAVEGVVGSIVKVATKVLIWLGKKAVAALINTSVTQTLGVLVSNGPRFLSACLSLGGLIAAWADTRTDGKFDGWIKI